MRWKAAAVGLLVAACRGDYDASDLESSDDSARDLGASDATGDGTGDGDGDGDDDGDSDWALAFDGTSYATTDPTALVSLAPTFSVELWIKVEPSVEYWGVMLDCRNEEADPDNVTTGWVFYAPPTSRKLTFAYLDASATGHSVVGPELAGLAEGWHHLAATRDLGGTLRLFIDGVPVAEKATSASPGPLADSLSIGRIVPMGIGPSYWWRGAPIDDVHISSIARHTATFAPKPAEADAGSVLLWHMNEGEGVVTVDEVTGLELDLFGPSWVAGD